MKALFSLSAVIVLVVLAFVGVQANLYFLFGVAIPYAAFAIFLLGFIWRVVTWARSPVPFRIPSTCGQQKSLPWIKQAKIENPTDGFHVLLRMFFEIFTFRSLFRNTKSEYGQRGPKVAYASDKWLWIVSLAFHYSFLVILIRHLRFFTEPVPAFLRPIEFMDGFVQVGAPGVLISGFVLVGAASYLLLRRFIIPQVAYISLPADYFPLFLIIAIGATGMLMRYIFKTDIVSFKQLTLGLATFQPVIPKGVSVIAYIHLFLVSALFAYFPFSKLMHLGGVWLSPTRNLANNNRMVRHINPWNYPVKVHTYDEYEDEYREVMKAAGIPVEKE
jgi:nitrate reductase gamma subunit